MSARAVRRIVLVVCVAGIAGMIASSIADNNGAAMTFGIVTAVAVLCLMVATSVTGGGRVPVPAEAEARGERVEAMVRELIDAGADEQRVRSLVGEAVRLGRAQQP